MADEATVPSFLGARMLMEGPFHSLQQASNSVNQGLIYQPQSPVFLHSACSPLKYGSCPAPGPRVYDFMIFQFYGGHLTDKCLLVSDHSGIYFAFKEASPGMDWECGGPCVTYKSSAWSS